VVKHLEAVKHGIGHVNIPVAIHRQTGAVVGISNFDLPPKVSVDIQNLNPMIPRIKYHEFAPSYDNLRWISKLPWPRPATALAKTVEDMALLVEHDNHVAWRVADVYMLRCRVYRYTHGSFEVGFAPFRFLQMAAELAF